jgi:hypothetical protein
MANFLAAPITNVATSLKLSATNEFAESGFLQIEDEVMSYTKATDQSVLHLTRGVNGTSAAAHAAGLAITVPTVWTITSVLQPMSEAHRDLVDSPAEGSSIYNLTSHRINVYDGSDWQEIAWSADLA